MICGLTRLLEVGVLFHVRELEIKKRHFDVAYRPGEIDFSETGLKQTGVLEARGTAELLAHTDGEIRVQGSLKVMMEAQCDRCLEAVPLPVESQYDLFYRPADGGSSDDEELEEGEAEMGFYEGNGVELEEVLREKILLEAPMQQVCSEACKGLCPVCGQSRNEHDCGCHEEAQDDRWAALHSLSAGPR